MLDMGMTGSFSKKKQKKPTLFWCENNVCENDGPYFSVEICVFIHDFNIKAGPRRAILNPIASFDLPHCTHGVCELHKHAYKIIHAFALGNNTGCFGYRINVIDRRKSYSSKHV